MRTKSYWIVFLMAIALVGLFGWNRQGQGSSKTVWEYKVVYTSKDYEATLNGLGAEGWELVTVAFEQKTQSGNSYAEGTRFYLRRAK